jgi:hypothetical protein
MCTTRDGSNWVNSLCSHAVQKFVYITVLRTCFNFCGPSVYCNRHPQMDS